MPAVDVEKLYELAGEEVERLAEEFYKFDYFLDEHYEIKNFLNDYTLSQAVRKDVLERVSGAASPLFKEVIGLLEKELLHEFSWLTDRLVALVEERRKVKYVKVSSAFPLEPAQLDQIVGTCGPRVKYNALVEPELIAGFRIDYADGRVRDCSLKGALEKLKAEMIK